MPKQPDFDLEKAHRYFAAQCFNQTWELIEKTDRSPEEDEHMLRLAMASMYHWTQRPDFSPTSASVGYWQISRVSSMLNRAAPAAHYASLALRESERLGVPPFCRGYAFEALSLAALVGGDPSAAKAALERAWAVLPELEDDDIRLQFTSDLQAVEKLF